MRLAPRSLSGQLALLVALALFVAQAVTFVTSWQQQRQLRFEQATGPVVARLVDAAERNADGRFRRGERGRVRQAATNPIPADAARQADVEQALARSLASAGVRTASVLAAVRDNPGRRNGERRRPAHEIVMAVEQPGRGWLVARSPWPTPDRMLMGRLAAQTLLLYLFLLVPVLWIGRRIARPMRSLTLAAREFRPGAPAPPLAEEGPQDVRALIGAFNRLRTRVSALVDEKDRMLGAIGHDLRTPLAALRVRIESVEDEADRTRMAETVDEMNRTLDDILSLARLGRPSEPPTEVDVSALVDAVVEDFRDLGHDVSFAEGLRVRMRLRPSLMRRAVRNLIENAVKYAGDAAVTISDTGEAVRIVVTDDGPGIPDDRLGAVFDPFTRLETSRNRDTGGIGLGLALARAIVAEAAGDIALANRREGGLQATITLPRPGPYQA